MKVLIANRGEIAVRIAESVTALGWTTQHVHARGEQPLSEGSVELPLTGVGAYLSPEDLVRTAAATGCDMVHPGYGFLSESDELATACANAGLAFIGPCPELLALFGDKVRSRAHAQATGVPVLESTSSPADVSEIRALLDRHPAGVMVKSAVGGGGRGMRAVTDPAEIEEAVARCSSESLRAFGQSDLYAERYVPLARHVEIQVIADGTGSAIALTERDCSIQRRNQKIIEVTPSPALAPEHRERLIYDARRLMQGIGYRGLATVEFLVDEGTLRETGWLDHIFIEVNPRLQVEHTITEELLGIDLIGLQLRIATGQTFADLPEIVGLDQRSISSIASPPQKYAMQSRVNAEHFSNGIWAPATGTVDRLTRPDGVRVDTYLRSGTVIDGTFDSLVAKVVTVTEGDFADATSAASDALRALTVDGVATNRALIEEVLSDAAFRRGEFSTRLLDDLLGEQSTPETNSPADPGASNPHDCRTTTPVTGAVVGVNVQVGQTVGPRDTLVVVEAMKMEHAITPLAKGIVTAVNTEVGQQVTAGDVVAVVDYTSGLVDDDDDVDQGPDLEHIRPDLAEYLSRRHRTIDENRPEAVEKRHARGHLTARESIDRLVDEGSFLEFGTFPVAAQRLRRDIDDLIDNTPGDGIITGLAIINGTEVAVLAYDYTVLAGTQGHFNHAKTDRMLQIAAERKVPVVLFAEGGGGRPGDVDINVIRAAGLNLTTFAAMGALSGSVPTIGVVTGRCFAGNAALLGCCDVIIGTEDATLGMAGPAMIEGGGLGTFTPEEVGPMSVQSRNGVVDILVEDDARAIDAARGYLAYFDREATPWTAADQRLLRHLIGENRKQVYSVRDLIRALVDEGSFTELRREFGAGMITGLARVEGGSIGLIANDPAHLGGAIDADGADKMARFLQLCEAHGLPVLSLCDTPGFMVGPESEKTATVRHFSRLFVIGAHLSIPTMTIILRKGYGLGAQAMALGSFVRTHATVAWPTGEIGGMGLEGAVTLGFAKELEAITDPEEQKKQYERRVDELYEEGKAINAAMKHEFDEVIDPAASRQWVRRILLDQKNRDRDADRARNYIDTW
ncbi:carboxyl transferase domain-containing protein [uncultured Dietzia sp.]|uniref:acetyl-CoA carboxylase family protein n=1 Tax=uncultured Dietzia sp. TaxID=395519 RepID=UPI0025EDEF87|nr:carboxyl transferase domain-containing protein [uncultured Dietzia sp.]